MFVADGDSKTRVGQPSVSLTSWGQ